MSSAMDSGYYADEAYKKQKTECPKSPTKKHEMEVTCGVPPSVELTCKHCKKRTYTK